MSNLQNAYTLTAFFKNIGFYFGLIFLSLSTIFFSPPLYIVLSRKCGYLPGQAVRRIIWIYGRIWIRLVSLFVPLKICTRKIDDYPTPCIILVNHQSFFDAFCMGALPIYNVIFVVRSWPFRIPFFGPYMRRAGYLNSENMSCETFLSEAKKSLDRGISVVIFPEGTRSEDGTLGRFYSGAFKLAVESKVPVVPVSLKGTGRFLPKGKTWIRSFPITIKTLPIVDPTGFDRFDPIAHIALRKAVKQIFSHELACSRLVS